MISSTRVQRFAAFFLLVLFAGFSSAARQQEAQQQGDQQKQELRGAPAEPDDAAEVRAQIAVVEKLLPSFVDRGAALEARAKQGIAALKPKHSIF